MNMASGVAVLRRLAGVCAATVCSGAAARAARSQADERGQFILSGRVHEHRLGKCCVRVSLPSSYSEAELTRYPVVYVLGAEPLLFVLVSAAARIGKCTATLAGRSWYPDFVVVGLSSDGTAAEANAGRPAVISEACKRSGVVEAGFEGELSLQAIDVIDDAYRTKPFASGRALIGHGRAGGAVACALHNEEMRAHFGHYLIGSPDYMVRPEKSALVEMPSLDAARPRWTRPPCSVYVWVGDEEAADVRSLAQRVHDDALSNANFSGCEESSGGAMAVVRVDRHGHQRLEPALTPASTPLSMPASAPDNTAERIVLVRMAGESERTSAFSFAVHAVEWLAARMERAKIEQLHRHLPWHEFR